MCYNYLDPIYQEYQQKHGNVVSTKLSNFASYSSLQDKIKETLKLREARADSMVSACGELLVEEAERVVVLRSAIKHESDHSSSSSITGEQLQELGVMLEERASKSESSENDSISSEEIDSAHGNTAEQIRAG